MNNIDERGYPGTEGDTGEFDGGDTAAIIGNLIALGADEIFPLKLRTMRTMLIQPEGLLRHPDRTKWWGKPDRFSRDQLIPILASFAGDNQPPDLQKIFRMHRRKWFCFAWNTKKNGVLDAPGKMPDLTGPEVWALWIRVMDGPWFLKLLLPILDLETLLGSITWRWFQPVTNRVCRNHMLVCIIGQKFIPTITMRLAYWMNNWPDLIDRWWSHTHAVKEYPTAILFDKAVKNGNENG